MELEVSRELTQEPRVITPHERDCGGEQMGEVGRERGRTVGLETLPVTVEREKRPNPRHGRAPCWN